MNITPEILKTLGITKEDVPEGLREDLDMQGNIPAFIKGQIQYKTAALVAEQMEE